MNHIPSSTRTGATAVRLSLVVPLFNEAANLDALLDRVTPLLTLSGCAWEVIGVDDGSRDDSFDRMAARAAREPGVKVLRLARNFGKEAAMAAGLQHASGDAVILMDGDLQHPPELIPEFIDRWRAGWQVVQAVRTARSDQSWLHRQLVGIFYRIHGLISEVPVPPGATDFCLLDRKVVDAVNALPERGRFFKGLVRWVGFRRTTIPFVPTERRDGRSGWTLWRLVNFALDGLIAFSTLPLRVWSWIGGVLVLAGAVLGMMEVGAMIVGTGATLGAAVLTAVLTLGGFQLVALGILGEYLARLMAEGRRRPLYLVAERAGFDTVGPRFEEDRADRTANVGGVRY